MVKSYIKLYGPPVYDGLRELEKIAIEITSQVPVAYYHACLPQSIIDSWQGPTDREELTDKDGATMGSYYDATMQKYFKTYSDECEYLFNELKKEKKDKLISNAGHMLGEYDFFFEWLEEPKEEEIYNLIKKIDDSLKKLNLRYSIVTKRT